MPWGSAARPVSSFPCLCPWAPVRPHFNVNPPPPPVFCGPTDYATSEAYPEWQGLECSCGSGVCRGFLRWDDMKLPELQERYAGHVLKHVARMIARTHLSVRVNGRTPHRWPTRVLVVHPALPL
jgi:hypothetical protein